MKLTLNTAAEIALAKGKCEWTVIEAPGMGYDHHETQCDDAFVVDGLTENNYRHCPSCGREILEVKRYE